MNVIVVPYNNSVSKVIITSSVFEFKKHDRLVKKIHEKMPPGLTQRSGSFFMRTEISLPALDVAMHNGITFAEGRQ